MINKVLTSFGFGNQSELLQITIPTFAKYASCHNYDLFIPNENFFSDNTKTRHYSWWKIELLTKLFDKYDKILWLDADVVVCNFDKDIFDEMHSDSHVGMVVHYVPIGFVPNCGVWVLDKKCMSWLPDLWEYNNLPRSDGWWEQDAMLHKLGMDSGSNHITMPESFPIPWTQLNYSWNPHVHDYRGIPERLRFFHATMFQNRPSVMRNVVSQLDI